MPDFDQSIRKRCADEPCPARYETPHVMLPESDAASIAYKSHIIEYARFLV
jgi:hypothetical protein